MLFNAYGCIFNIFNAGSIALRYTTKYFKLRNNGCTGFTFSGTHDRVTLLCNIF